MRALHITRVVSERESCSQSYLAQPAAAEMFVFAHLQVKLTLHVRCYFPIMLIFSLFFLHQLCVVLCNLQRGAKSPGSCGQAGHDVCAMQHCCRGAPGAPEKSEFTECPESLDRIWHGQIRLWKQTRLSQPPSPEPQSHTWRPLIASRVNIYSNLLSIRPRLTAPRPSESSIPGIIVCSPAAQSVQYSARYFDRIPQTFGEEWARVDSAAVWNSKLRFGGKSGWSSRKFYSSPCALIVVLALKAAFFPPLPPPPLSASLLKTSIFVFRFDDQITTKMSCQDLHFFIVFPLMSRAALVLVWGHQSRLKSLLLPLAYLILILRQSFNPRHWTNISGWN